MALAIACREKPRADDARALPTAPARPQSNPALFARTGGAGGDPRHERRMDAFADDARRRAALAAREAAAPHGIGRVEALRGLRDAAELLLREAELAAFPIEPRERALLAARQTLRAARRRVRRLS